MPMLTGGPPNRACDISHSNTRRCLKYQLHRDIQTGFKSGWSELEHLAGSLHI